MYDVTTGITRGTQITHCTFGKRHKETNVSHKRSMLIISEHLPC